jgi:hypothetical protein
MNNGEDRMQESGIGSRVLSTIGVCGGIAALILGVSLLATGCGKPPRLSQGDDKDAVAKGDPWEAAAKRLRKETDVKGCKTALAALNHELTSAEKVEKPTALSKEDENRLGTIVPLHATDRDEIRSANFSPHDPVYLAECLFLRDAARSLALSGLLPEQQTDIAFAWVCRQVALDPWLYEIAPNEFMGTALPPAQILRRGSGSGLERMYVFLALLQQMGLDGCLIGPPAMENIHAAYVAYTPDKSTVLTGAPRGPFFAVGVRIEKEKRADVRLYDPWRAEPIPAPLGQLRTQPESHRAWLEHPAARSGLTVEAAKTATAYLAVPVNALAPRMALLEKKLKDQIDVRLAIDPAALRDRFGEPKLAYWNPAEDQYAYGRVARAFLPVEEGGEADRFDPKNKRLYAEYIRSQLPAAERVLPPDLLRNQAVIGDVKERIEQHVKGAYFAAFMQPPTPRELVERGQFQDASRALVQRQDEFSRSLLRVRNTEEAERKMREWAERATELYRSLGSDPDARTELDKHWQSQGAALVLDRAVGEVGRAEATLLLALCRHEQAERVQSRLEHAATADIPTLKQAAADAWGTAVREWSGYLEQYSSGQSASRAQSDHVRALADRARRFAQER